MSRSRRRPVRPFHELPLLLFTTLGVAGAGVGSAHLLRLATGGGLLALSVWESVLLSALLLLGLVLSAGHVGKFLRGPLAVKGVGRSPLSNEVIALGVTLGLGVLSVWGGGLLGASGFPAGSRLPGLVGLLASLGSVAFLLALGLLYDLPGRLTWQGPVVLHPLILGTAWGLLLAQSPLVGQAGSRLPLLLAALLVLDGGWVLLRIRAHRVALGRGEAAYPRFTPLAPWLHGIRLLVSLILVPSFLLAGWWLAAVVTFSLALLVDRVAFYALVVLDTTESEIARVEALL